MQPSPELVFLLEAAGASKKYLDSYRPSLCPEFEEKENQFFWRSINYIANKNRISGLLYSSLIDTEYEQLIPDGTANNLMVSRNINARRELLYSGLILQLLKFNTNNSSIWISGSFLIARCFFPNRGQITFDHLDLFVESSELTNVSNNLEEIGYRQHNEFYIAGPLKIKLMDFTHPILPGSSTFPFKEIQSYFCEYDLGGISCKGPSPELLLAHLALRFNSKRYANLVSLISAKACIHHDQFSWENLAHLTEKQKSHESIQTLLHVLSTLFSIEVPTLFSKLSTPTSQAKLDKMTAQILTNLATKKVKGSTEGQISDNTPSNNLGEYVGTPQVVVDRMLEMANLTQNDIVYDLGCGDGRFLISAVQKYNCRGVGIEYDKQKVEEASQAALKNNVNSQLEFIYQDVLDADVSKATVLISYLNNNGNTKLLPKLRNELPSTTRVLTHQFTFPELLPEEIVTIEAGFGHYTDIYVWNL